MIPSLDLTSDDWRSWETLARRRRPWRALQKIGRGILEAFGVKKGNALFEEALTMSVVRLLKAAIENHPILVAYKDRAQSSTAIFAANVAVVDAPASVRRSASLSFHVKVKNLGNQIWYTTPDAANYVRLGVQLLDRDMRLADRDYHRESLTTALAPGLESIIRVSCPIPNTVGDYGIKIDLVCESVAWFESRGSHPAMFILRIRE
jgi:hypothetical protein